MILSTKLLRRINMSAGKICGMCKKPAEYYDAALPVEEFFFYCGDHAFLEDLDPDDILNQRILGGSPVSRKMVFPECADIEELFSKAAPVGVNERRHTLQMWANVVGSSHLEKWDVVTRPAVLGWMQENTIYGKEMPLDRNYFIQINRWEDRGFALVSLKFQQILGTHYLAIVPWETVEKFFGVKQQ